jgi:hypothetical protein
MQTHPPPPLRQIIACLLLPTYLAACTTWKTQEASPQQVLADEQPGKVQVELADGSRIVLEHPVVSGDTLMGVEERWSGRKRVPGNEVSIPLSDIESVAVRSTDVGMAITLGVLSLAVVGAVMYLAACSDSAYC